MLRLLIIPVVLVISGPALADEPIPDWERELRIDDFLDANRPLARDGRALLGASFVFAGLLHGLTLGLPADYMTLPTGFTSIAAVPFAVHGWKGYGLHKAFPLYDSGRIDFHHLRYVDFVRWKGVGNLASSLFCFAQTGIHALRWTATANGSGYWEDGPFSAVSMVVYTIVGHVFFVTSMVHFAVADLAQETYYRNELGSDPLGAVIDLEAGPTRDLKGGAVRIRVGFR